MRCYVCAMSHDEPSCTGRQGPENVIYWHGVRLGSQRICSIAGDMLRARLNRERHGMDDEDDRRRLLAEARSLGIDPEGSAWPKNGWGI